MSEKSEDWASGNLEAGNTVILSADSRDQKPAVEPAAVHRKQDDLKQRVESILFSTGTKITFEELAKLVKEKDHDKVLQALQNIKQEYDTRNSSLMVVQDGPHWKLTVREAYLPIVRKIVTQTELPKSVMETLAVVASKAPVLQSKIISIRTNKAYDHLAELETAGYLTREKKGRTKLIKLAKKFFDYFDIPEDQLKIKFGRVEQLEQAIESKEAEIAAQNEELKKKQDEAKQREEAQKKAAELEHARLDQEISKLPEVTLLDDEGKPQQLEQFEEEPSSEMTNEPVPNAPGVEIVSDKLGKLEVVDIQQAEPKPKPKRKRHAKPKPRPETPKVEDEITENAPEAVSAPDETARPRSWEGKGLFATGVPEHVAKRVDERVEEIVSGKTSGEQPPENSHAQGAHLAGDEALPPPPHAKPKKDEEDSGEGEPEAG